MMMIMAKTRLLSDDMTITIVLHDQNTKFVMNFAQQRSHCHQFRKLLHDNTLLPLLVIVEVKVSSGQNSGNSVHSRFKLTS